MGTTSKGFRYPEGTDKVVDGDDAIRNLATDSDNATWGSTSAAVSVPIGATSGAAFTFPVGRFSVAPWVYGNASTSQGLIASPGRAQSNSSVTMTIRNINAAAAQTISCHLLAVAADVGTTVVLREGWHAIIVQCVNDSCSAFDVPIEVWVSDEAPLASVTCGTCGNAIPFEEEP